MILLENETRKALNEIRGKLAALERLTEEVYRLRTVLESKEGLIPRFVECSPEIRTYRGRIEGLFRSGRFDQDLYIMGYFDQIMLDKLLPMARYVRIISPAGALKTKKNKDALRRINKAGAKVRTHPMLHARIFCVPDRRILIIGSGDLQTDCLGGSRFDAGVWSNYPELIKSAIDFFNRVWEESEPLPEASA